MLKNSFILLVALFIGVQSAQASTESVRFYPEEGAGGVSSDGRTFEDRYTDWGLTVHSTAARIASSDDNFLHDLSNILGDGFGPNYYALNRIHFSFDTSSLPDSAVIESAKFLFHGVTPDASVGSERRVYFVDSNPIDPGSLQVEDYATVGDVSLGVSENTWEINGWNQIIFNQNGLLNLNKEGVSSFAVRGWYDFNEVAPTDLNGMYIHMYMSEAPGTSSDPYLEITYEVPDVEDIYALLHELIVTVKSYTSPRSVTRSYLANLKKIERLLRNERNVPAQNQLLAFTKKLKHDSKRGVITNDQYEDLRERALVILGMIPSNVH
jgi:hypothetical protein